MNYVVRKWTSHGLRVGGSVAVVFALAVSGCGSCDSDGTSRPNQTVDVGADSANGPDVGPDTDVGPGADVGPEEAETRLEGGLAPAGGMMFSDQFNLSGGIVSPVRHEASASEHFELQATPTLLKAPQPDQ